MMTGKYFDDFFTPKFSKSVFAIVTVASMGLCAPAQADDVRDYGEYLSGECTTCHSTTGADKGIPSIIGWDTEGFIETLNYYKSGERDNAAMVDVAKNLDDEQMKALAVYFGSLEDKAAEKPAEKSATKPAEKSATKPADKPISTPATTP